jgi:hypothetical protein
MRLSAEGCAAAVMPVGIRGPETAALLIVKVTKRLCEGELADDPEPFPVWELPREIGGRTLPGDATYPKEGVDLIVVGDAFAPQGKPATVSAVIISIGGFSRTLAVWGDRVWKKGVIDYLPSEPEPFLKMPVDFRHAYGGVWRDDDGNELPYVDNPLGKGFILPNHPYAPSTVEGTPLPNIEWPDRLVTSWKDTPEPAGCELYPLQWGLRLRAGVHPRGERKLPRIVPALFNQAHPAFVLPAFPADAPCRIVGMTESRPIEFTLSPPALEARIERANESPEPIPLVWDTLCVLPGEGRLYMVARARFVFDPAAEEGSLLRIAPTEGGRS